MGFSRQEYWSGLPFSSPADPPNPGIEPRSPALQADSLLTELQGKIYHMVVNSYLMNDRVDKTGYLQFYVHTLAIKTFKKVVAKDLVSRVV